MTRIKLCGLMRPEDIETANRLTPDYIGFVFAGKSRRRVTQAQAEELKNRLSPAIRAVGVFVGESPETVAGLLNRGIIDLAQLHGDEDEAYLRRAPISSCWMPARGTGRSLTGSCCGTGEGRIFSRAG